MYVQLNCVIVDSDATNRQELADVPRRASASTWSPSCPRIDGLPAMLGRPDAPQLVIINLDPNAQRDAASAVGHLPRQYPHRQLLPDVARCSTPTC